MSNRNYFKIKSIIELKFENSTLCEFSYNSFLPEFSSKKPKRSSISMEKKENTLIFQIESSDITAFRATISDIISFGKIIDNSLRIVNKS